MHRKIVHRKLSRHSKRHKHRRGKYTGTPIGTLKSNETSALFNVDDYLRPRYHSTITQPSGSLAS